MLAQPFTKKTLIVVLILTAALITLASAVYSAPAASVSADRSYDAISEFRRGERAQMTHVDAQYEFRLGEIAQRAQYAQPVTSWTGSTAYSQYRQGEWFGK